MATFKLHAIVYACLLLFGSTPCSAKNSAWTQEKHDCSTPDRDVEEIVTEAEENDVLKENACSAPDVEEIKDKTTDTDKQSAEYEALKTLNSKLQEQLEILAKELSIIDKKFKTQYDADEESQEQAENVRRLSEMAFLFRKMFVPLKKPFKHGNTEEAGDQTRSFTKKPSSKRFE